MRAAIAAIFSVTVMLGLFAVPTMSPADYCKAVGISQHEIATNKDCQ